MLQVIREKATRALRHPLLAAGALRYRAWCHWKGLDLVDESNEQIGVSADCGVAYINSGGPDLCRAIKLLGLADGNSVLDIGCGKGGALIEFHRCGYRTLAGIDLSARMLEICRSNLDKAGVGAMLIHGDAAAFTAFKEYELIYMWNTLPVDALDQLLGNLRRFVAETGLERTLLLINPFWHFRPVLEKHRLHLERELWLGHSYWLFHVSNAN
jgi:SAM-dependent methyltransferase